MLIPPRKLGTRMRSPRNKPGSAQKATSPRPNSPAPTLPPTELANPEGYVGSPVPDWIAARRDLTPAAKLMYGYLLRRYNSGVKCAFPSQQDIGKHLGFSRRWVSKLGRALEAGGFIRAKRRKLQLPKWKKPSLQTCYSFLKHPGMEHAMRTRRRQEQDQVEEAIREHQAPMDRQDGSASLGNDTSGDPRVLWEE